MKKEIRRNRFVQEIIRVKNRGCQLVSDEIRNGKERKISEKTRLLVCPITRREMSVLVDEDNESEAYCYLCQRKHVMPHGKTDENMDYYRENNMWAESW